MMQASGEICMSTPAASAHRYRFRTVTMGVMTSAGLWGANFLLMVIRHEALHGIGAYMMGGRVSAVIWLPTPWTFAAVEMVPPLTASPVSYYVPLCLPYVADLLLILTGAGLCRIPKTMTIKTAIFQLTVYFSSLDILMNGTAGLFHLNDFALIFSGWGIRSYYPAIVFILVLTVVLTFQRRRSWKTHVLQMQKT